MMGKKRIEELEKALEALKYKSKIMSARLGLYKILLDESVNTAAGVFVEMQEDLRKKKS